MLISAGTHQLQAASTIPALPKSKCMYVCMYMHTNSAPGFTYIVPCLQPFQVYRQIEESHLLSGKRFLLPYCCKFHIHCLRRVSSAPIFCGDFLEK